MKLKQRGFTLIEMLVVLAIIGIIFTIVITSLGRARIKSRDRKRVADMQHILVALELYKEKNGAYPGLCSPNSVPISAEKIAPGSAVALELQPYMGTVPTDPLYDDDPANYYYAYDPMHYRNDGVNWATVVAIRRFEDQPVTPDRQTNSGGDLQINQSDWNRELGEPGYGANGPCPPP